MKPIEKKDYRYWNDDVGTNIEDYILGYNQGLQDERDWWHKLLKHKQKYTAPNSGAGRLVDTLIKEIENE